MRNHKLTSGKSCPGQCTGHYRLAMLRGTWLVRGCRMPVEKLAARESHCNPQLHGLDTPMMPCRLLPLPAAPVQGFDFLDHIPGQHRRAGAAHRRRLPVGEAGHHGALWHVGGPGVPSTHVPVLRLLAARHLLIPHPHGDLKPQPLALRPQRRRAPRQFARLLMRSATIERPCQHLFWRLYAAHFPLLSHSEALRQQQCART